MIGLLRYVIHFLPIVKILSDWYINKIKLLSSGLKHIRIRSLANLALELFKVVTAKVWLLL